MLLFVTITLLLFHSYITLNSKYVSEYLYYLFGSWKETLFLLLFTAFFAKKILGYGNLKEVKLALITLFLICYGTSVGIINNYNLIDIIVNARDFMLPFVFYFLFANKCYDYKYNIKYINYLIIILFAVHGFVSVYSYLVFDGDIEKIWVAKYFTNIEKGVGFSESNYVRNEKLRSLGLFSSPLEYALSMLMPIFILFYYAICAKKLINKIIIGILLSVYLLFAYVANVRTWLICFLLGIAVSFLVYRSLGRKKLCKKIFFGAPLSVIFATFAFLCSGMTGELSALGRIDQYIEIPRLIFENLAGFGFGDVGPKGSLSADSNILTLPLSLGILGATLYIYLNYGVLCRLLDYATIVLTENKSGIHSKVLCLSLLSYGTSYIYASVFQFTMFYAIQYIFLILIALIPTIIREHENKIFIST